MSTTPKEPNAEDAGQGSAPPRPALEQTFLGVAPTKPGPTPPAPPREVSSPAPVSPVAASPGAAAPARGSAIIAAPMISVQGERAAARAAAALPASARAFSGAEQGAMPAMPERAPIPPAGAGQRASAARGETPEETPAHGTPRDLVNPAGAGAPLQPQRTLAPSASTSPAGYTPEARAPLAPQVPPRVELGQQRTALASEYLRAARDAALAAQGVPPHRDAAAAAPRAWSPHETRAPSWANASPQRDVEEADPRAVRESAQSRDEFGTQASVAPPFTDQDREGRAPAVQLSSSLAPPAPLPVPPPIGALAASPMAVAPMGGHFRPGPPPLARTLLDGAPEDRPSSPPFGRSSTPPDLAGQFEQVPMPRGSLSEQSALQIPIDQSSSVWDQAGFGHDSTEKLNGKSKSSSRTRWLVLSALAALAVAAIGFVTFGDRLMGSSQRQQALLPRPAEPPVPPSRPLRAPSTSVVPPAAGPSGSSTHEPLLGTRGTTGHEIPATAPAVRSHLPSSEQDSPEDELAAASAARAAEAVASPEDKLAAEAARQVIASRYPEALPMYRELARKFPENTAYGAMVRILEQKVAAAAANGAKSNPGAAP